jgi:hypothetical protein
MFSWRLGFTRVSDLAFEARAKRAVTPPSLTYVSLMGIKQYVANSLVASLQLSFLEPLKHARTETQNAIF